MPPSKGRMKPIILTMSEVQSILAGNKRSIRRIVEPPLVPRETQEPFLFKSWEDGMAIFKSGSEVIYRRPQHEAGETVFVQESFVTNPGAPVTFKADYVVGSLKREPKWRPPSRLTHVKSRLRLHVKEVRAEQVQSITAKDAILEGIIELACSISVAPGEFDYVVLSDSNKRVYSPIEAYRLHWGHRFKEIGGLPWERNPLVWAMTFEPEVVQQ